jgi:hypothetical protein
VVIGLLDAGGNPTGLGYNLKGLYAKTWQEIVEKLGSLGAPFLVINCQMNCHSIFFEAIDIHSRNMGSRFKGILK